MARSNLARSTLLCGAVATLVAGCYTMDPYSGDRKVSDTTKGAGIGALAGAAAPPTAANPNRIICKVCACWSWMTTKRTGSSSRK